MSVNSKLMKWRMEQVWKTRGCVCPNHLASWSTFERGYRFYDKEKNLILLWFKKGRIMKGRSSKPKGKGFSFLPKNYKAALMIRDGGCNQLNPN
jgi:hypothetical protein